MDKNHGFRFRDWSIYNDARNFRKSLHNVLDKLPKDEKFGLTDQIRRASLSIILNIAEGANKNTDKDMKLYINRAHCSLDEVVACIDCTADEIDNKERENILKTASELAKQLNGFTKYLSRN